MRRPACSPRATARRLQLLRRTNRKTPGEAVHITAKVDYAVRTLLEIARAPQLNSAALGPVVQAAPVVKADAIATAQRIPPKVLETVLGDLRRADLVISRRGPDGGYWLARPAAEISVADVIR